MKVRLSEHFSFKKIFLITIAPICMMVFTSLYSIIDGIFIANFSSASAFAGVNLVFPLIMVIGGIGFMLGTGGSALVSKLLGEKKNDEANKTFTMIIVFTTILGILFSIIGCLAIEPLVNLMASISIESTQEMISEAIIYGRILMLGQVAFMLQNVFQSFFMVDEKPFLGFLFTIFAGLTNIILDGILVGLLNLGTVGAALATIIGYIVGGIGPFIYFLTHKNGYIHFSHTKLKLKPLLQSCFNGSSEFVNQISTSIVSIVFNLQLLKYYGENGINAYGIIMYVSFVFLAIFIGYSIGIAPVISYHYGANNTNELKNVLIKSLIIIGSLAITMFILGEALAIPFATIFSKGDSNLISLATTGMRIYSISFLCSGLCILISSYFTALNNGLISAIISFLRTLVFQISFVFILPLLMGAIGIWWAIVFSEVAAIILAIVFLISNKNKYKYL